MHNSDLFTNIKLGFSRAFEFLGRSCRLEFRWFHGFLMVVFLFLALSMFGFFGAVLAAESITGMSVTSSVAPSDHATKLAFITQPKNLITGPPPNSWNEISANMNYNVALLSDGTLWAWGSNSHGQLGNGTITNISTPTQVSSDTWIKIAAGDMHVLAIKSNGTLWGWGENSCGQSGIVNGSTSNKLTPTQIGSDSNWSDIFTGYDHSVAIKSNGTIWSWGCNRYGQLGDGTEITPNYIPTQVGNETWSSVSAGYRHTIALKSDGTLWSWGINGEGQLGHGDEIKKLTPTQEVTGATNWSSVFAGFRFTIALKSDGTLWSWGSNNDGQLGHGDQIEKHTPTQEVTGATNWTNVSLTHYYDMANSDRATIALKSDGTLWYWGETKNSSILFNNVLELTPTQESTGATDWTKISLGSGHLLAIKNDGTLWSGGNNSYGQLGDKTNTASTIKKVLSPVYFTVEIQDMGGNIKTSASNPVTITITPGTGKNGAILQGTTIVSAVNGVASFPYLRIDNFASGYTFTASASGLQSATSSQFTVSGRTATSMSFSSFPPHAVKNQLFSPQPVVSLIDIYGNPASNTGTVSIAIVPGTGDATASLLGTKTVNIVDGTATFTDLKIDTSSQDYKLVATHSGLTAITSLPFTVWVETVGPSMNIWGIGIIGTFILMTWIYLYKKRKSV